MGLRLGLWVGLAMASLAAGAGVAVTDAEAYRIGREAYTYLYPLVTMEMTRRQMTSVPAGRRAGRGPMNTFTHLGAFPRAEAREVVRPNFDTLYSLAWLDLREGPQVVTLPDSHGRYHLMAMLDMWTDVFAVPGTRTTGNHGGRFALVPPGWQGRLPQGLERIQAPTAMVWIVGRIQANGSGDFAFVRGLQAGCAIAPLAPAGPGAPGRLEQAAGTVDPEKPPLEQVNALPALDFFRLGADLMRANPPHLTDQPILARMKRIGLEPGRAFDPARVRPGIHEALLRAVADERQALEAKVPTLGRAVNGWRLDTETMGVYGNDYRKRAAVAMAGLGANQPEDAVYPLSFKDAFGRPYTGSQNYTLHFDRGQLPPVNGFWSLTLYDREGFQVANPLGRFTLRDRDRLVYNRDGSLDLLIQHDSPGTAMAANWLPAPEGPFNLALRLYAPKSAALDGSWEPPGVQPAENRTPFPALLPPLTRKRCSKSRSWCRCGCGTRAPPRTLPTGR